MTWFASGITAWLAQAGAASPAAAAEEAAPRSVPEDPFVAVALPLLEGHCFQCHGEGARVGVARLDRTDGARAARREGDLWQEAIERVEAGRMPPKSRPPLPEAERAALVAALKAALAAREPGEEDDPGAVVLRRLGRFEFDRTIRALFGVAWSSADLFPADPIAHGIDDLGDVQTLPPMLFEKYDEASRAIVARLLADDIGRQRLLAPALSNGGRLDATAARAILAPLAERAFRRPVGEAELEARVELFRSQQAAGVAAPDALATALRTLLLSPEFLFRPESGDPSRESGGIRPLTGFELATRLSYFLWSEPPDPALLAAAGSGELDGEDGLRAHARRLLADPRARTLAEHFAAQWLGFGGIDDVAVDIRRFGRFFGLGLRERFRAQALEFFAAIVHEDRDVRDLIDSDWTIADPTLAEFYGVTAPPSGGMARVALTAAQRGRGGLLGLGAVLTTTSFPLRTSPVLRGRWILGTLLDREPPPPPADVPALPKDDRQPGAETLRQRLERHRADPACAGCHATMDALGFALENFDAIGGWRDAHEGSPEEKAPAAPPPIDARSTLPDGTVIDGPLGLREWLRREDEAFLRAFTRRMFTFAVGRPPGMLDEETIAAIVAHARVDGARFHRFVEGIVTSRPFRYLRAPR